MFLKRLSDVFADEMERLAQSYGDMAIAQAIVEGEREHGDMKAERSAVRFYVPENARWKNIRRQSQNLGQYLTDAVRAVARENPRLQEVIDIVDFNATTAGQRIVPDDYLARLINVLSRHRPGLKDVEPDISGRAYEYLLRKFAEGGGQSAGEFYTPRKVAELMVKLLAPEPGMRIYKPTCGSGNQGSNYERDIRRKLVEADFIEAVILLPENLFSATFKAVLP